MAKENPVIYATPLAEEMSAMQDLANILDHKPIRLREKLMNWLNDRYSDDIYEKDRK